MTITRFEWDMSKNAANRLKHGLTFERASQVFRDPLHEVYPDRIEDEELRWHAVGTAGDTLLVLVVHVLRERFEGDDLVEVVRIISARRADRAERRRYEENNR